MLEFLVAVFMTSLRFTDFLVFEIDQQYSLVRLQNISKPDEHITPKPEEKHTRNPDAPIVAAAVSEGAAEPVAGAGSLAEPVTHAPGASDPLRTGSLGSAAAGTSVATEVAGTSDSAYNSKPWPERFTSRLFPHLSLDAIEKLKQMFLEGPTPPPPSADDPAERPPPTPIPIPTNNLSAESGNRETKYGGRIARGARGGKGARDRTAGQERPKPRHEDHRKVVSDVSNFFNMTPIRIASELGVNARCSKWTEAHAEQKR
jgi:tRNA pseudouridine13 synthase